MRDELHVINGRFERNAFPLECDVVLVGRGPDNHIRLDDRSVSRSHLKILRRAGGWVLVDLSSRNRTRVDGRPIEPNTEVPVNAGRPISVGNVLVAIGQGYEEAGLTSGYMIDLACRSEGEDPYGFLKDRRILDREMLSSLYGLSVRLMQSAELSKLLEAVAGFVDASFESADTLAVFRVDEESGEVRDLLLRSKLPKEAPGSQALTDVVRRTVEDQRAVILSRGEPDAENRSSPVRSVMCVPLVRGARTVGALYVHSVERTFAFGQRDLHLFTALGASAGAALQSALRFHAQQELLRKEIRERKRIEGAFRMSRNYFRDLFDNANDLIQSVSPEGLFLFVNRVWMETLGYTKDEVAELTIFDVIAPESLGHCKEAFQQVLSGESLEALEAVFLTKDGRRVHVEGNVNCRFEQERPVSTRAIFRDVTQRKKAEAALCERTRELDMRYKQVYCLYAVSRLKGRPGAALEDVLEGIVALIPPALQYPDIACARLTHQSEVFESEGFRETAWTLRRPVEAHGVKTGRVEVFYREERPERDEGPFLVEERTLLHVIAEQVGEIIELKQAETDLAAARERELDIGSKIQETLLLGSPPRNLQGVRIASMTVPSQRIDGDFYEFITLSESTLDVIVGDVMGKGVPAALLAAGIKGHFLKALSAMLSPSRPPPLPADIVQAVHNRMVHELVDLEAFVTLIYARFDLERNRLEFVDCGHPRILRLSGGGAETTALEGHNVPLGFRRKETYRQVSVPFEEGDLFFFYSDGITEARDAQDRLFGRERLLHCLQEGAGLPVEQVVERVRDAVMAFSNTRSFPDDLTCVAVRIGGDPGPEPLSRLDLELPSRLEELEGLRLFVRRACTMSGLEATDEDTQWQIGIAVNEAFSNIVKHAYEEDPEGRVRVEVEVFPDEWVFTLRHRGKPFPGADHRQPPPVDLARDHGFGLIIMDNYMDNVSYSSAPDGTQAVRLVKKRRR